MVTPTRRVQRRAQLTAGRFGQFTRTKQLGAPIDFVWPCTNGGDADGIAFIKVREPATGLIWDGPPFTIPMSQTVPANLHQTIDLSLGLHSMVPELHEGLPPDGMRLIASDTLALTIVSNPVLSAVGLPTINGVPGAISWTYFGSDIIPISWQCQNSGGGAGRARLLLEASPANIVFPILGSLVHVPGFSTVTLLLSANIHFSVAGTVITVTLLDEADVILGTHQFFLIYP